MAYKIEGLPKGAVVGYGGAFNMGKKHLTEMAASGITPTAVVELDPERLKVAEADFPGIETYTDLGEMLEKSEANVVAIITPHNTHASLAFQCLRADRHVVTEKPMTITTEECDRIIDEAHKRDLLLSCYHNRHWDGSVIKAREIVQSGEIGEVFRIEAHMGGYSAPREWWRSRRSVSGGILYDWGVHLLEYSLQIFSVSGDTELTEVSGYAQEGFWKNHSPDPDDTNEDEGYLVARFKNGKWLTMTMTSLDSYPKNDRGILEVTGTQGTLLVFHDRYQIRKMVDGENHYREGKNPPGTQERYYQNIGAALRNEEPLIITPEWARRPVHILDLAVKSAKAGHALPAKYA
ncbi:MAG: hypothetical protein OHK0029_16510 [Armatimonadaceae bacterium]